MVLNQTSPPNISAEDTCYELDASIDPLVSGDVTAYNNGYVGSEVTMKTNLSDDKVECKILLGHVKTGLDDSEDSSETSDDDVVTPNNCCAAKMEVMLTAVDEFFTTNKAIIKKVTMILLLAAYCGYLVWAIVLDFNRAMPIFTITMLVVAWFLYAVIRDKFGAAVYLKCCGPIGKVISSKWHVLKWIIYVALLGGLATFLALEVNPRNLVSLAGFAFFIGFLFIFSAHPSKVRWRPVVWGLSIQFLLAIFILRTTAGYATFKFLGDEIQKFLSYTDFGSKFVFGKKYTDHFFAFVVLPVVVFFSCVISTLYHLGIMQAVIGKIAWIMQITMGTAPTESLTAAGNIFVGQTEAPILVRPFIRDMTLSELHAMMTGGFATIAGGVLAAYIMFGVPAEHLLCASVMNAPVALAVSKLFYPETRRSKFQGKSDVSLGEMEKQGNILEAAAAGASSSIKLVANIAANLIAFLALLAFVNATLSWFGSMVGYSELSFQLICSYIFRPVAFLMGVEWEDTGIMGELLGTKLFLNEFVAYEELGKYIKNRQECKYPQLSVRTEIIATYALCGFANLSSIGIQLGGIGPMAPERKGDLAKLAVRALTAGFIVCLITASVAGALTPETPWEGCGNSTLFANLTSDTNSTLIANQTIALNSTGLPSVLNTTIVY
ncbi:solute carrier family 28 member 3-like [Lineus longissimus]|uniref:solute carrier family 28 member 3-like n=1 Tax=Lineus longissimus TaxID=88925 RepID=UPI002B4D06FD